jgi:hypothetical protein
MIKSRLGLLLSIIPKLSAQVDKEPTKYLYSCINLYEMQILRGLYSSFFMINFLLNIVKRT